MPTKAMPIVNFAQRMPMRQAGPMPRKPQAGQRFAATGKALKEVGGYVQDFASYQDKLAQSQGKADLQANIANARMNQMIKNRQLRMKVQAAKERWQNSLWKLKNAKDLRDKVAAEERSEAHKWKKVEHQQETDEYTRKKDHEKQVMSFEKELNNRITTGKINRKQAFNLAMVYGVDQDPRVRGIIKDYWPQSRNTYFLRAGAKKEEAGRMVEYLESELVAMSRELGKILNDPYLETRIVKNPSAFVYELTKIQLSKEAEQRADVQALIARIHKKTNELHKAKSEAGIPYEGEKKDTGGILEQIEQLRKEVEAKRKRYEGK